MAKLVLDTNILISSYIANGKERALLDKIADKQHELFITREILAEFIEVLARQKFKLTRESQKQAVTSLMEICTVVEVVEMVKIIKDDPDDDKILECALACNADYIVSGDHHLLDLKQFNDIPIIRTHEILGKPQ